MSLDLSRSISQVRRSHPQARFTHRLPLLSRHLPPRTAQEGEPPPLLDSAEGGEPADAIKIKIAVKKQACFAPLPVCTAASMQHTRSMYSNVTTARQGEEGGGGSGGCSSLRMRA